MGANLLLSIEWSGRSALGLWLSVSDVGVGTRGPAAWPAGAWYSGHRSMRGRT